MSIDLGKTGFADVAVDRGSCVVGRNGIRMGIIPIRHQWLIVDKRAQATGSTRLTGAKIDFRTSRCPPLNFWIRHTLNALRNPSAYLWCWQAALVQGEYC